MVDWLHLSQVSGSGDTIITVTADTYSGVIDRLTSLVITGRSKSVTVPVEQVNQNVYDYLTFEFTSNGTWGFGRTYSNVSAPIVTIEYSKNGGNWVQYTTPSGSYTDINVASGDVIRVRGLNSNYGAYGTITKSNSFRGTASFNVRGNIMSLVYGDDFADKKTLTSTYTFTQIFMNSNLQSAEMMVLPATGLTEMCYYGMFGSCTAMTQSPKVLPASTLATRCYQGMFSKTAIQYGPQIMATTMAPYACRYMFDRCGNLITSPELHATVMAEGCYELMFCECTALTTGPVLSATTLADLCYSEMFQSCTSLTNAPALPAMTLAPNCYTSMFSWCTALQNAPALPATTLAEGCYTAMFQGCSSLTNVQTLPATTLAPYCYQSMFEDCTSLMTAPTLPAPILVESCYDYMFLGCTSLNYIHCLAIDISARNCTYRWVRNVASSGTFVKATAMNSWTIGENGIPTNWVVVDDDGTSYLTFNITEGGTILWRNTGNAKTIYYSKDNSLTWSALTSTSAGSVVNVSTGDKVYFRGDNAAYATTNYQNYNYFGGTAKFTLSGNIMSLISSTGFTALKTFTQERAFCSLFRGCTGLTSAQDLNLAATALTNTCYNYMFNGCTNLTSAPVLPATTLANYCYMEMFSNCTSLTTAPSLPATTTADYCYQRMFAECTSLTNVPGLPATTVNAQSYMEMFSDCTALVTPPVISGTTLGDNCYMGMFQRCTSLTTAPQLPATTLGVSCYAHMFNGCRSLTAIPDLPATALTNYCYQYMFSGCTSVTESCVLSATTLTPGAYYGMFQRCTSLSAVTCLATNISANSCTTLWLSGVASNGVFTKAASMSSWGSGGSGIPNNWSVVDAT